MRIFARLCLCWAVTCLSTVALSAERPITVMSFNVENLFDAIDDPDNDGDNTYLPKSKKDTPEHEAICNKIDSPGFRTLCLNLDWTKEVVRLKLTRIAEVITAFVGGKGPDVLILQEVENKGIVRRLRDEFLSSAGYTTLETFDTEKGRGIDVALLSRLQVPAGMQAKAHPVDLSSAAGPDCSSPRDILEVPLELPGGDTLTVFGVHFPSPRNPKVCRDEAMKQLNALQAELPEGRMSIAAGDFNITCRGEQQKTLSELAAKSWIIPTEPAGGCQAPGSNFHFDRNAPPGARVQWSFLDIILGSKSLSVGFESGPRWFVSLGSFRSFVATSEQILANQKDQVKPKRFKPTTGEGVSDHWPVVAEIVPR